MCPVSLYFLCAAKVEHSVLWYIFLFMFTYHFSKVRTACCLLHQDPITHKCCVILEEPKPQMFTHLPYLFMKAMPSWLHAEISGILPFSFSSKCSIQTVHWVIHYTFRMSVFTVSISGCFQPTEIYKFITVPVWMPLVQTGIWVCLCARDVPSIYQNVLRALVILSVYCTFERTLTVKQTYAYVCAERFIIHLSKCFQSKQAYERISVPKMYHPFICGAHNEKVTALMNETGVRINIPPLSVQKDEITIAGEKEGVMTAKERILSIHQEMVSLLVDPWEDNTGIQLRTEHFLCECM